MLNHNVMYAVINPFALGMSVGQSLVTFNTLGAACEAARTVAGYIKSKPTHPSKIKAVPVFKVLANHTHDATLRRVGVITSLTGPLLQRYDDTCVFVEKANPKLPLEVCK